MMHWGGMVQLVNLVQHLLLSANMTLLFEAHRPIDDAVFQLEKIFLRL